MRLVESVTLHEGVPGTPRAVTAFPTVTTLADGSLLSTCSIGTGKDTDDLQIELRRSTDGGRTWSEAERPVLVDARRRPGLAQGGLHHPP